MIYQQKFIKESGYPKYSTQYNTDIGLLHFDNYYGHWFAYTPVEVVYPKWYMLPLPEEAIAVVPTKFKDLKVGDIVAEYPLSTIKTIHKNKKLTTMSTDDMFSANIKMDDIFLKQL